MALAKVEQQVKNVSKLWSSCMRSSNYLYRELTHLVIKHQITVDWNMTYDHPLPFIIAIIVNGSLE